MKLEKNNSTLLFSFTEIPDVFFTEYLSQTKGDYIKVYLYMVFLTKFNKEITLNDLSKKLDLPFPIIQDALKYFEKENLLLKKNNGYIINNLQEIELHKLYSPRLTSTPEELKKTVASQTRAKAIENINNKYFQGVMSPSWYSDIDLWFKKYSFDEEVMNALFAYCYGQSALHRNYIQTVADAWTKQKIHNFSDLEKYMEKRDKINEISKDISKKLGFRRNLTQFETAYVEKWTIDYMYSTPIIDLALRQTTSKSNPNFEYINKILTDWHERNLKTPEEVNSYLSESKVHNASIKNLQKAVATNQVFENNSNTNLNAFYDN